MKIRMNSIGKMLSTEFGRFNMLISCGDESIWSGLLNNRFWHLEAAVIT